LQNGNAHLAKGNNPGALAEFLKAEELDPTNPNIHNSLGLAYYLRGRMELAESHFTKALAMEPKFTEARNNLGRTYIELKKYKDAVRVLKQASEDLLYRSPEKTLSNLGLAYFNLHQFAKAEQSFFKSLQIRRKDCLSLNYHGRSLLEMSQLDKAVISLDQAVNECKLLSFEEPYYYSAVAYMKMGKREFAIARIEEGLALYPQGEYAQRAQHMLEILK